MSDKRGRITTMNKTRSRAVAAGWTVAVFTIGLGMGIATGAGNAHADARDLTNVEVAGGQTSEGGFSRFDTGIEYVPSSGGQGAFDYFTTIEVPVLDENGDPVLGDDGKPKTVSVTKFNGFDDGLSDSSRDMLDRINEAKAAETP